MRYHPLLDTAPSSIASTILILLGSFLSLLGCSFILYKLYKLKYQDLFSYWHTRHYLICILAVTNLIMALTALVSAGFYLVFGQLASKAGCTISGMVEFWSQQAVEISTIIIALAAFASVHHSNQWMRHRHWIQTNIAPIFGLILFLPLVTTVASQIIWRFRSSEFAYCWVPRFSLHARWLATDGWRTVTILGLICAYVKLARTLSNRRNGRPKLKISWPLGSPGEKDRGRGECIDSAGASRVAGDKNDQRGLFSQSMFNMHRWARSVVSRHPEDSSTARQQHEEEAGIRQMSSRSTGGGGFLRTYEQFKRSLGSTFTRHIHTDIPSPTIPPSIFDSIGSKPATSRGHPAASTCNFCSSSGPSLCRSRKESTTTAAGGERGLRHWYSALSHLLLHNHNHHQHEQQGPGRPSVPRPYALRRSHTAPVQTADEMGFSARSPQVDSPIYPGSTVMESPGVFPSADYNSKNHQQNSLTLCPTDPRDQVPRILQPKTHHLARAGAPNHHHYLSDKIQEMFGSATLEVPTPAIHRVSIHRHQPSAVQAAEGEGYWAETVEKYRSDRSPTSTSSSAPNPALFPSVSRLYVYPLAYIILWLPSIVYYIMSTYIYYQAFQAPELDNHTGGLVLGKREMVSFGELPGKWSEGNMSRAWPYLAHATKGVRGSQALGWLAVVQALHMLGGLVNAILFWITEQD
ncbi:hypothetical protein GGF37_002755 [Kickxella alabastrina]|nr:hypothetical protein GGF37_002755 [Kickxella alabastrina]